MNKKETIKLIINRFQETNLPTVISRTVQLPINSGKIISVIGPRRCGKTYLLFDTIAKLIAGGIAKSNILMINFEDERLQLDTDELDLILQTWREMHQGIELGEHYFFFDEIQNIRGWEKFVRRIYDNESRNIFISGSNSAFLSSEIATSLRGRSVPYEIFPFSFKEYLNFKNLSINYNSEMNRPFIINELKKFLQEGGYPETLQMTSIQQSDILRTYYYVMIYKDLIERYEINAVSTVKYFIEKLADNVTKHFSLNNIYNQLRSQGIKLDKNLIYQLVEYIQNIYLAFSIQRHDYSLAARSKSDKKAYFIDNGLLNILTHSFSDNMGKLLENAVFIFLKTNYGNIYESNIFYYKDKSECDFVVFEKNQAMACIQVSYDISDAQTLLWEQKGLLQAMNHYGLKEGFIITLEQEREIDVEDKKIFVRPAFKVLIDMSLKGG